MFSLVGITLVESYVADLLFVQGLFFSFLFFNSIKWNKAYLATGICHPLEKEKLYSALYATDAIHVTNHKHSFIWFLLLILMHGYRNKLIIFIHDQAMHGV